MTISVLEIRTGICLTELLRLNVMKALQEVLTVTCEDTSYILPSIASVDCHDEQIVLMSAQLQLCVQYLYNLHEVADKNGDGQMADFVEVMLEEQVNFFAFPFCALP